MLSIFYPTCIIVIISFVTILYIKRWKFIYPTCVMGCIVNLLVYKRGERDPFGYVLIVVHHTSHVVYVICTHMIGRWSLMVHM